jgi:DNA-binding response OmpR family regulator
MQTVPAFAFFGAGMGGAYMLRSGRVVLVVDDERKILEVVSAMLQSKGFTVLQAETGRGAMALFEAEPVSLVVLDLMLPDTSGEELCAAIRKKSRVPIIMLTAKAEESDMLKGLGIGADDYVIKPFSLKELYARVEAVLRRSQDDLLPLTLRSVYRGGDLVIDFECNTVLKKGTPVPFTPSEMRLLAALMKYPGRVLSRDDLIARAMGGQFEGFDRAIDSHIKNIRQKIEDDLKNPVYILTVHGVGYKFGGDDIA